MFIRIKNSLKLLFAKVILYLIRIFTSPVHLGISQFLYLTGEISHPQISGRFLNLFSRDKSELRCDYSRSFQLNDPQVKIIC